MQALDTMMVVTPGIKENQIPIPGKQGVKDNQIPTPGK